MKTLPVLFPSYEKCLDCSHCFALFDCDGDVIECEKRESGQCLPDNLVLLAGCFTPYLERAVA